MGAILTRCAPFHFYSFARAANPEQPLCSQTRRLMRRRVILVLLVLVRASSHAVLCGEGTYLSTGPFACLAIPACKRYHMWSSKTATCVARHAGLPALAASSATIFLLNLATKCQETCWYTKFFLYNVFVSVGVAAECTRSGGGVVSAASFDTMVGFLAVGALALGVNLVLLLVAALQGPPQKKSPVVLEPPGQETRHAV